MKKERIASYFPTYEELKKIGKKKKNMEKYKEEEERRKRTIGSSRRRTLYC